MLLTTTEIVLNEEGQFTASTKETPSKIRPIVKVGHITKNSPRFTWLGSLLRSATNLLWN